MFFGTVECSTVQCTTVDNTAVYCSTQYSPLQHSVLHCITVYYNMVKYIPITTMQCTTVQYTVLQCTVQCAVEFYSYSSFLIFQELFGRMLFPEEPSQPPGGPSSQRQPCLTEKVTLHLHTCSHTHTPVCKPVVTLTSPVCYLCCRLLLVAGSEPEGPVLCLGSGWRAASFFCTSSS